MNVTIIGTGYVGLVTGACLADLGNNVFCLDVDQAKIDLLNNGSVPIYEPGLKNVIERNVEAGRLIFSTDVAASVAHANIQFIAVGTPLREFLYVDDMAAASVHVMNLNQATYAAHTHPAQSHINVGFGSDVSIAQLARSVAHVVGYQGDITFDSSKPDGAPRKLMNSTRLNNLGWGAQVGLDVGLALAYADFQEQPIQPSQP